MFYIFLRNRLVKKRNCSTKNLNFHDIQAKKSSRYKPDFVTPTKGIYF